MNKSDSERVASVLETAGASETKTEEQAEFIVINTCSVRNRVVERTNSYIGRMKKQNPNAKIVITGCLAKQKDFTKIHKDYCNIIEIAGIAKLQKLAKKSQNLDHLPEDYLDIKPARKSEYEAFLPIMTGCNNFCSYCIVPYLRGRERSKSARKIIDEVKKLIKNGCKQITLLGQNVNSYKYEDYDFSKLLASVAKLDGKFRIFFITSHPKDISDKLIDVVAKEPKICKYFHFPIQAGDNEILQKMNRGYTREQYIELVENIRNKIPSVAISTDAIVGFPGETKEQFENTKKLFEELKFDMAYTSMYSPRPMTKSSKMKDDVPNYEKKKRDQILQEILKRTSLENNEKLVGKIAEVMPTHVLKTGKLCGKNRTFKTVIFEGNQSVLGKFVNVKILQAMDWGLSGKINGK